MSSFLKSEFIDPIFSKEKSNFYGRRQARPLKTLHKTLWEKYFPLLLFQKDLWNDPRFWKFNDVCLEIGFGSGEHLSQQALTNSNKLYIGCEPFVNGVASLLKKIEEENIKNILIFPYSIHLLLSELSDNCLEEVFLLFADPWPKKRHHKRRFIQMSTIKEIYRVLKPEGLWKIATDHPDYQKWIKEHFEKPDIQYLFNQRRPNIHKRPEINDWPETRYEQKAFQDNRECIFLEFKKSS